MERYGLLFLLTLLFSGAAWADPPEKYAIRWRYDKGLANLQERTIDLLTERALLKADMKSVLKKEPALNVQMKSLACWSIVEVQEPIAVVQIIFRNGSVRYERGSLKHYVEIENPAHQKLAEIPSLKPYIGQICGGVAFNFDKSRGKIFTTWLLEPLSMKKNEDGSADIQYNRKKLEGDPFFMEDSFGQLPGKEVPIGHEWKRTRRDGGLVYHYNFLFSGVESYSYKSLKTSVVRIQLSGKIMQEEKEVGKVEGFYLHSHELDTMMHQKVTESFDVVRPTSSGTPAEGGEQIGGVAERISRTIEIRVRASNATRIPRGKQR